MSDQTPPNQPPVDPAQPTGPAPTQEPAYTQAAPGAPTGQPTQPGQPGQPGQPQGGAPTGPTPGAPGGPGTPAGNYKSSRGKTIGLIIAGVVAVGAIGGIGAAIFGGDDGDDLSSTTGTGTEPEDQVTPDAGGGGDILDPSPVGSATPEPSESVEPSEEASEEASEEPSTEPSASGFPTEAPPPSLDPDVGGDLVTIGNGVQVAVLPGWQVVGQGDNDVLLGDSQNSFVYAVTGTVDPSADAASVIAASMDNILPGQNYTQLQTTDISPLQAFGSVVSMAGMQYRATWTDQQASVPLQGLLICAVRQDGTAIIMTAEHTPPKQFEDSVESWGPVLNTTLGLFGAA